MGVQSSIASAKRAGHVFGQRTVVRSFQDRVDALDADLAEGDVAVIAPAGYGKTWLIEAWTRASGQSGDVLRITSEAALGELPTVGNGSVTVIDMQRGWSPEGVTALADWLDRTNRPSCLLACRTMAGLRLQPRLHAGRLNLWTRRDLLAAPTDIEDYIVQAGLTCTPRLKLDLHRRSGGWWAGVAMLVHAKRSNASLADLVNAYFEDELQGAARQLALPQGALSGLPHRLTPELYQAATGRADFFELIACGADIEAETGDRGEWRFGVLFHLFLRHRAQAAGPIAIQDAHARIAEHMLRKDRLTECAVHARESGNDRLAMRVVDLAARRFIAQGRIAQAQSWLDQVDRARLAEHPRIWVFSVTAAILSGRWDLAEAEAASLDRHLKTSADVPEGVKRDVAFHATYNRLLLAQLRGSDVDLTELNTLLLNPETHNHPAYGEALLLQAISDLGTDSRTFDVADALPRLMRTESWYAYVFAQGIIAERHLDAGDRVAALDVCDTSEALVREAVGDDPPCLAILTLIRARAAVLSGDFGKALVLVSLLETPLADMQSPRLQAERQRVVGELYLAMGRPEDALRMIGDFGHAAPVRTLSVAVRAMIAAGRPDDGRDALGVGYGRHVRAKLPITAAGRDEALTAALNLRALIACGEVTRAQRWLPVCVRHLEAAGQHVDALRLRKFAHVRSEEGGTMTSDPQALRRWAQDCRLAQLDGLVAAAADHPFFRDALADERGAQRRDMSTVPILREPRAATVSLTPKELDILAFVALGHTNQQIADETLTSLSTVKWHVRNLLSKFDARNRTGIVNRARQMGFVT